MSKLNSLPDPQYHLRHTLPAMVLLVVLGLFQGCGFETVKPWQRGILAKEEMQLVPDSADLAIDEHIYFSKEAANGGEGIGGGGCGCN